MKTLNFPVLIDGGLSNVLEEQGCDLNHPLWSAKLIHEHPDQIIDVHYKYLLAGAQIITTASYQASIPGYLAQGFDQKSAEAAISRSVGLAEEAILRAKSSGHIDYDPLIAGSIGPYGAYLADGSEYRGNYGVSQKDLIAFHKDRLTLLNRSNAHILACETIPSLQETKVLSKLLQATTKPSWISFSCKNESQINDGSTIEEAVEVIAHNSNVFAVGINCTAPQHVSGLIKRIKSCTSTKKVIVYPNSGEAYNSTTKTWIGLSEPDQFVQMAREWKFLGADLIGGCCRIGPAHIRNMCDTWHYH
ncbi:MAG: homocysteine S-methyltransferase [Cyclobacteriaceae bacterium]